MSAFKQKLARLGATAGVLAASTAAFMAVGGATAGSALAGPPSCVAGPGVTLQAEGSTLQRVAQEKWTAAYNAFCGPTKVNFKYTGTGSGAALTAFAFNGSTLNKNEAFVGSDEAPNAAQIKNAKEIAGVPPVIVPVAQTTIAIIAHAPAACALPSGQGLTYADLSKLFAGTITKWSQVSTIGTNKPGCEAKEGEEETASPGSAKITREVRSDGSGTSYQFKNYLSAIEGATLGGVAPGKIRLNPGVEPPVECGARNWAEIRENKNSPKTGEPNITWPESDCNSGVTKVVKNNGGGGVASGVVATQNSIGYAALPDAEGGLKKATEESIAGVSLLTLQNGENTKTKTLTYGSAVSGTGANCASHTYSLPEKTAEGVEVNWSTTFGANPTIQGTFYPLCTLTFDLGFKGYTTAGFASNVGPSVSDYIKKYVLAPSEGQTVLGANFYQALPANVLGAAETAAGKLE
jgi:ABC-type phosphate transport system substrate-binding protein